MMVFDRWLLAFDSKLDQQDELRENMRHLYICCLFRMGPSREDVNKHSGNCYIYYPGHNESFDSKDD